MNTFKEQDQYRLFLDTYNYILLTISYIESNIIWLSNSDSCYKYDRKTERLYKWCGCGYDVVDTEYGFSKLSSEDVWEARKQPTVDAKSCDFSRFYGD
jgi:hypothetical protein